MPRMLCLARSSAAFGALALLAACASHVPGPSATQEAARYAAQASNNYVPPGPAEDPWGPYIREAAARFDVPELWIRAVMHVESNGQEYMDGQLTTSGAGAMGLMQVMPATYDELRQQYNLGSDPYDPHNNIMAGAAYMREMYDIYGSPGFLAAYNAGPNRLDDYLSNNRPLPDETRRYVAMIGPEIVGVEPDRRSPAEQYAMNALPIDIPPGMRYGRTTQFASQYGGGGGRVPAPVRVEVAQLPEPPQPPPRPMVAPQQYALVVPPPPPPAHGFHFIAAANAEPIPFRHYTPEPVTGTWGIQVGAFVSAKQAHLAVGSAREHAYAQLGAAHPYVASVHVAHGELWRARLTGLSRGAAVEACGRLSHARMGCEVLSPESQM
ncbi:MAG TPA: lytic transglycosylase domain-containing protein [Acetobacteraceae bacterium]|nr:lytic transglycosylase domain-containing protein [Acetobacteraceae bacterium]